MSIGRLGEVSVAGPALVLVGGFLGAGKTTLILRAAAMLRDRGMRVAVITNDQDRGIVDTRLSRSQSFETREVAGGCFCCRFSLLLDAAGELAAYRPQVIFAEPVGSCVDISATILQPLKQYHRDVYRVAPFTVLVDPDLAAKVSRGEADAHVSYLFKQQLAEADLVCSTKHDLRGDVELPMPLDFVLSADTGLGVGEWLGVVLNGGRVAGARILDVDYDRYAEAEAALGWLNLHARIRLRRAGTPASIVGPLLDELDARLSEASISIAHLKVFDQSGSGYVKASVCGNGDEPRPEGDLAASPEFAHEVVVNLRAIGDPRELEAIARAALARVEGEITVEHVGAFRPSRPRPEHRFTAVISNEAGC